MATLIKGIQSKNLDWNFVLAGAALALVMELCGIRSLSFAIGVYLPISTTLPIYLGGVIRGLVDKVKKRRGEGFREEGEDLEKGNLFATGLVAGGALAVAAKTGLLAKLIKPIIVGVALLFGFFAKFYRKIFGKSQSSQPGS